MKDHRILQGVFNLKKINKPKDLEYNDGFGDLLREKTRIKFSWLKTGFMLMAIILSTFIVLTVGFNIMKTLLIGKIDIKDQNQLELYKITHVISVIDNKKTKSVCFYFLFFFIATISILFDFIFKSKFNFQNYCLIVHQFINQPLR